VYDYVDSNYVKNVVNWRSIMRYMFMLNDDITAWMSKKQCTISTSTTKAEYIALRHDARQKIWMQRFINELKLNNIFSSITLENNELSIKLMQHKATQSYKAYQCTTSLYTEHDWQQKLIVKWVLQIRC
jgi:hypothetical protein